MKAMQALDQPTQLKLKSKDAVIHFEEGLIGFSEFKDFVYREKYKLQFRAEAFNVLNTPNFANPGVAVGTQNFGVVTGDGNILPREMQLSLRFSF